jgi:aminotransferase
MVEKAITPKTKALILCNPNNPTGATIDRERLLEIADVVKAHDLILFPMKSTGG